MRLQFASGAPRKQFSDELTKAMAFVERAENVVLLGSQWRRQKADLWPSVWVTRPSAKALNARSLPQADMKMANWLFARNRKGALNQHLKRSIFSATTG